MYNKASVPGEVSMPSLDQPINTIMGKNMVNLNSGAAAGAAGVGVGGRAGILRNKVNDKLKRVVCEPWILRYKGER